MNPPSLHADIQAECTAIFRAITGAGEPDVDAAGLMARYGLDRVADILTQMIKGGMTRVAHKRGHPSPEVILDEYIGRFFRSQTDELRDMVRGQIRRGLHPPIPDRDEQEEFLLGLFTLHCAAVIELAGKTPARQTTDADAERTSREKEPDDQVQKRHPLRQRNRR